MISLAHELFMSEHYTLTLSTTSLLEIVLVLVLMTFPKYTQSPLNWTPLIRARLSTGQELLTILTARGKFDDL